MFFPFVHLGGVGLCGVFGWDSADFDIPRYQDGKFGSGKWKDDLSSVRRKSSSSEDILATILVRHMEDGVKVVMGNKNISSQLVGPDSVREENIDKGVMVPYACADSRMFHSVEDPNEVAGNIEIMEMVNEMGASLAGGLNSGLDHLGIMVDNLMEVKVGVADNVDTQDDVMSD
ncbi:hypothetical protein ACOSQ2_010998 [Xanthoceras sorbifolium]